MYQVEFTDEYLRAFRKTGIAPLFINDSLKIAITKLFDINSNIFYKIKLIDAVLKFDSFRVLDSKESHPKLQLKAKKLKIELVASLKLHANSEELIAYPHHTFHPYLDLYLILAEQSKKIFYENLNSPEHIRNFLYINKPIEIIKKAAKGPASRASIDAFRKIPHDNFNKMKSFVSDCFRVDKSLNLVRIDLFDKVHDSHKTHGLHLPIEEVKEKLNDLLKFITNKLAKNLYIGYAWKVTHSTFFNTKIQLWVFFLPDGATFDVALGKSIGDRWKEILGDQSGYINHTNTGIDINKFEAGRIFFKKEDSRIRVKQLCKELFIEDHYVRLNFKEVGKCFSTSIPIDPRISAADRKEMKRIATLGEKGKVRLHESQLPFQLKSPAGRTLTTRLGDQRRSRS